MNQHLHIITLGIRDLETYRRYSGADIAPISPTPTIYRWEVAYKPLLPLR